MENKTIIYVLVRQQNYELASNDSILGFFTDRKSAEYYIWKQNKLENEKGMAYMGSLARYIITEIMPMIMQKFEKDEQKDYQKFLKEKSEEIQSRITKLTECSSNDIQTAAELKKEMEHYSK